MEDMTARAQELSEMAIALQRSVSKFVLDEDKVDRPQEQQVEEPDFKTPRKKVKAKVNKLKLPDKVARSLNKRGIDIKIDSDNDEHEHEQPEGDIYNANDEEDLDFEFDETNKELEGIDHAK